MCIANSKAVHTSEPNPWQPAGEEDCKNMQTLGRNEEKQAAGNTGRIVIGVDEAGRGPLCGMFPVNREYFAESMAAYQPLY